MASSKETYGDVQSRNSSESLSTMDAEFALNDGIAFVHRPQKIRQRKTPATNLISRPPQKSCVNRFCAGIYNFFCRVKPAAVEDEDRHGNIKLEPAPIKYQSNRKSDVSDASNCRKNISVELLHKCLSDDNAAGDYIIYVPRVSISKLQRNYIEPLRQARFEPIILKTGSTANICRKCSTCVSCHMSRDSAMARNSNRSLNKLGEKPSATFKNCDEMKPHKKHTENESPTEIVADDPKPPSTGSENRTGLLYVPSNSKTNLEIFSFTIHEKTPSCINYQMRHEAAFQKRQSILDATKERLRLQSQVCSRRKLIADMKKSMDKEKKSWTCSPPNMLESRFHHIHWLGNCRSHNLVGRYFDKEENNVVALKIFGEKPFDTILEDLDNRLMAIQEINSLTKLEHKNIVKLLGYFELQDKYHLILESCDHSLREDIQDSDSGLGATASKKIMKQLLNGLHFSHQANCLHRDLSPENILVCKNGTVKICDFDRSIFLTDSGVGRTSPTPGSFRYNSPEILAGDKEYGLPSDVWSLGIIFCEMITGKPPWNGTSAQSQLREIHKCVGPLMQRHASVAKLQADESSYTVNNQSHLLQMLATLSTLCRSFITKCLDVNPLCRYTCGELLQHPFIKGRQK